MKSVYAARASRFGALAPVALTLLLLLWIGARNVAVHPQPSSPAVAAEPATIEALEAAPRSAGEDRADAPSAAAELVVRVEHLGQPVVGATVELRSQALAPSFQASSRTDDRGRCVFDTARVRDAVLLRLTVRADGFGDVERNVAAVGDVSVELTPLPTLRGVVRFPNGEPAGEGFHVLAHVEGRVPPSTGELSELLLGRASGALATTDAEGRFAIPVEDARAAYGLRAGGRGWMTKGAVWRCRADVEHTLTLLHAYGARALFRDAAGAAPHVSSSLHGTYLDSYLWSECEGVEPNLGDDLGFVLAGGDPALLVHDSKARVLVFVGTLETPRAEPNFYRVKLPGYAPVQQSFAATALELGLSEFTLSLSTTAAGFGTLAVKVNCAEPALAEIFEASPIRGGITLTDPATGVENALPVTLSRGEACVIDGVPFGRYRARFECRDTGLGIQPALPPGDVLEVTGDGSEITIDLDRCGALRIRAADDRAAATQSTDLRGVFASGAPHLNARGKWQSSDGSALIIRSWPHVIFPLPEGEYSVSIPRGVAPAGDHGGAHVVGVHVGRVTDFELTLASN